MSNYNEELNQLYTKVARYNQLENMIVELQNQYGILSKKVSELERMMYVEQADVDRLEKGSLASFFYNVIGRMDEKLDQEREEAYRARVKYDSAKRELDDVGYELDKYIKELKSLGDCKKEYAEVLKQKAIDLKAKGDELANQIIALEEQYASLITQEKELNEALQEGKSCLNTANEAMHYLKDADTWGTIDIFGGGLISDYIKHNSLDRAQQYINQLQSNLRRFKTELADVTIHIDTDINVEGFLRFADYFFDNLFTDWAVMDKISKSKNQIKSTIEQIKYIINTLQFKLKEVQEEKNKVKNEMEELVKEAN